MCQPGRSSAKKYGIDKPILKRCAALRALFDNENRTAIAFQTAELSIIEYDIFNFFSTTSTFGTGNGNDTGGIFLSGLVFLISGWMEHYAPNPKLLSSKLWA
jgi:hypothetical protein